MEASRLMEDLLGYMERRIQYYPNTTYKAPKLVIDCGHDTTVAPMQMFMFETWEDKPEYGVNTQYCGFACNLYFELYKDRNDSAKYYVYYYIDDELIHIFDYKEFNDTVRAHIFSQDEITEYCITDEQKEEREGKKKEEEELKRREEELKRREEEVKKKKKKPEKKNCKETPLQNLLKSIHFCGLDYSLLFLQLFWELLEL
jgi:hypothetical protein